MTDLALHAAILAPLALALLAIRPGARPLVLRLAPAAPLPALALALLAPPVATSEPWLMMGTTIALEPIGSTFLAFTALLWCAAAATARRWMREDAHATSFVVCFLLAMAGNLGLILAGDAFTFYALFALMSFSSFGLVVHGRSEGAYRAGRLYIAFVIAGELALFAGLVLATREAGSALLADLRAAELSGLSAALLIGGFAVKLGIMPLHFWLPPAHGAAPVPASAVLSGAMIKAGLYGMLASLPLGLQAMPDHGTVVTAAGLVTMFAAVLLGLRETSPKAVLGFSSVSQMGIVALALGAGLIEPASWAIVLPVVVFLAAHHALAKGALFLGAGLFGASGSERARFLVLLLLAVPALSLAGLAMTSGALGKEALKAALENGGSQAWAPWLVTALVLSGVATTLLMARFAFTLWTNPPGAPAPLRAEPESLAAPFLALATLSALLPFLWPLIAPAPAYAALAAKPADPLPIVVGALVALAAIVRAHALAIGPGAFWRQITAPIVLAQEAIARAASRIGRAIAVRARRVPAALSERAETMRLGQTAIAALIAAVLVVGFLELWSPQAEAVAAPGGEVTESEAEGVEEAFEQEALEPETPELEPVTPVP